MTAFLPRLARLALGALVAAGTLQAHGADNAAANSPTLVVDYHVRPADRAAFRRELEGPVLRQFQRWQSEHLLKGYRLLFNRYADSDNWDAMAVLSFDGPAELARWRAIERTQPAGLAAKALALTSSVHTAPVEWIRGDTAPTPGGKGIFVVIPYATLVSAGDYLKYADGYVIPQFEGWMHEGVLAHYGIYAGSFPAGRPWSTLVLLEYRDEQALAERNAVVAKVRDRLKDDPAWKAISDDKKKVRDEKQVVIADPLGPN